MKIYLAGTGGYLDGIIAGQKKYESIPSRLLQI